MNVELTPVGKVKSPLKDLASCPLQENENSPPASIEIFSGYHHAAADIKPGDDLLIVTWLDKGDRSVQKTHPRNDKQKALTGVFSTRSPHRPNPLGIHLVRVTGVTKGVIDVDGLEVLDQTLVIDIKSR